MIVEGFDGLCALSVIAGAFQFSGDFRQNVIDNLLTIGRYIAALGVIIALSYIQRIKPSLDGDGFHHALGKYHALRPTKAAEGGVGDGVGVQAAREDGKLGVEIAIV